jgi:hypothetical protein
MRAVAGVLLFAVGAAAPAAPLTLYDDQLRNGFVNGSYFDGEYDFASTAQAHTGTRSIRFDPGGYNGLILLQPTVDYRSTDYQALRFWVHGGTTGGQQLALIMQIDGLADPREYALSYLDVTPFVAGGAIVANAWREVVIPLDAPGLALTHGGFNSVFLIANSNGAQGRMYVDDIAFDERTSALPSPTRAVAVDFGADRRPIDPEIYGVNFGSDAQHADLRYPVRRNGGNSTTRYNWQQDVHNTAFDYFWQNIVDGPALPATTSADAFMDATRASGGQPLMTLNTLGRVPVDVREKKWSFSIAKYGPQDSDECRFYFGGNPVPPGHFCQPDAGNGTCANVQNLTGFCVAGRIVGNDYTDTSKDVDSPSYAAAWVAHMQSRYGTAANGGIRYFSLDNEPHLWNSTHRDVHPAPTDYEEVWEKGRDVAIAVKAQEPNAKIFGPDTWGWCDLNTSALDAFNNGPGGSCITGAERTAHGGVEFARWYLQQAAAYDAVPGNPRLIDYLDVHWYPQGDGIASVGNDTGDELPDVVERRFRSLRELYDPTYRSESYVDDEVFLIRRLKSWIAADYPGTKLAITEYKWGPDDGPSGALAQAEALAIFGREGLDLSTRWVAPAVGSRSEEAFRMFLDYDGANTRLVGDSVRATSPDVDELGVYAIDRGGTAVYVLVFNKATGPRTVQIAFSEALNGPWSLRRFDALQRLTQVATGSIAGSALTLTAVPGRSANLLVLPARGAAADGVFMDGFE